MWVWKYLSIGLVLLLFEADVDHAFGQHGHGGGIRIQRAPVRGHGVGGKARRGGGGGRRGHGGGRGGMRMSLSPGQIQALRRMGVKRDMDQVRANLVAAQNAIGYANQQQQKATNKLSLLETQRQNHK